MMPTYFVSKLFDSQIRKEAISANLFNSRHLEEIVSLLVLSLDDYLELFSCYVLSINGDLDILSRLMRLVQLTENVYRLSLSDDWMQKMREKCMNGNPVNGLLFTSVLFYYRRHNEHDDSENGDWSKMLDQDQWLQAITILSVSASVTMLLDTCGQSGQSVIRSISAVGLQTSGIGAISELVSDWLISWYLSPLSPPHTNPKIALCQMYIRDHLTERFPKSLSSELLNTAVFWAATSTWSSTTKRSVSDKLLPIIIETLHAIKVTLFYYTLRLQIGLDRWKLIKCFNSKTVLTHKINSVCLCKKN